MEKTDLTNKIVSLVFEDETNYLQISFFNALNALYLYVGEELLSYKTKEEIEKVLNAPKELLNMICETNENYICLDKYNELFNKILNGLAIKINKEIPTSILID